MAINRQMFEATQKVSRANPGVVLDLQHSNGHELLLVHPRKQKFWSIDNRGNIRKVAKKSA